jgi:hypothetical protein
MHMTTGIFHVYGLRDFDGFEVIMHVRTWNNGRGHQLQTRLPESLRELVSYLAALTAGLTIVILHLPYFSVDLPSRQVQD